MSRNLMVLFLLMTIVCATVMSFPPPPPKPCKPLPPPPPPKCPKNEIYKECGTCQPTCKNPNPVCIQVCIKGCFCKNGQLRNKWGKCVEPCDC